MFWIDKISKSYIHMIWTHFDNTGWVMWNNFEEDEHENEREVKVVDVTCREGDQSPGTSMNKYEKASVALWLKRAWVPVIEIWFPANPVDYDNTKFIMEQMGDGTWEDDPVISVLWRANRKDTEKSLEVLEWYDKPRIHIFIATSEAHLKEKFWKWERWNYWRDELEDYCIEQMQESLDAALEFKKRNPNLEIELSLEDASQTRLEFFKRFIQHFDIPEVTCINIPDTMWVLTDDGIASMFQFANENVEHVELSTHNHDDRGMADSNSLTALKKWASYAETTLEGAWEWPWNARTATIVNNIDNWDVFDNEGKKMVLPSTVIPQEVWYVSRLFRSIVNFDKAAQSPYVWELAFEDAAWVHAAAKSVYRAGIDSTRYGHVPVEEFFSARWGETQMVEMMAKHGIEIQRNTRDEASPEANYWMRRCIRTSERDKYLYSRDMYAMYIESQWDLSVWPIELSWKKIDFWFTYKWKNFTISWEGWQDQGFIHGFINGISNFIWDEYKYKLIWVDPKNKTPLRQSTSEYLDVSDRTQMLSDTYKSQLMWIVEMDEKNHFMEPVRELVWNFIRQWVNVHEIDQILNEIVEKWVSEDIVSRFHETVLSLASECDTTWVLEAFNFAVSEIEEYSTVNEGERKWGSQLWICTSTAEINWEKVHSTVANTNLDHATLISIFRTALPEIIRKIDSES